MASAQTLTTNILINARTGNGFSQVGATLTELGSLVNGFSQGIIEFGKDSINVYRDYEKSMKDAEVALSTTYGRNTKELSAVMSQLDASATEWAATTIFHTNDVANAISEMAHAGWDADRIMAGMPAAMELAQAGSLDLSEAVDYIVKSTNSLGIESTEDIEHFIDIWSFAANSSASTIQEFGDAMLRMGSTMRFAADPEELMTLIAVTANAGQTGEEAGTLIRNSMMRLVAPTKKAREVMEELGASSDEAAELMDDEALAAANARLAALGFSAFDEQGQLKNVLDIYRELYLALGEVAGGFDNIERNQDALAVLSAIFPTRTITEALTLLRGASEGYEGLYEAMKGGAASGYGTYAAETMMDTLNGKIETFQSKVERLKQITGAELAPQLEQILGGAGEIVDRIADMDEGTFSALVSGLEVIAGAGPGLIAAGSAFRLIGNILTPTGTIGMGLITVAGLAAALKSIEDTRFKDNFGNMGVNMAELKSYAEGIGEGFRSAYSEADTFREALDNSISSYETASSTFSSRLFTHMLTNAKLTETDRNDLRLLGNEMYRSVQEAIQNSADASRSYWEVLFGEEGAAEPAFQEIIDITNQASEEAIENAEGISRDLRRAMTEAFADGEISDEEYQNILSYLRSYNDAMARASEEVQNEEDYIQRQKWLHQAQGASWDEVQEISKAAEQSRDQLLADEEDRYLTERYRLQYRGASEEALAAGDQRHQERMADITAAYDPFFMDLYGSQREQNNLSQTADGRVLAAQYDAMGGAEGIAQAQSAYESSGDTENATKLKQFQKEFEKAEITAVGFQLWNPNTWLQGYSTKEQDMRWADALGAGYAGAGGMAYTPVAEQEARAEAAAQFWQGLADQRMEQAETNPYTLMPPEASMAAQTADTIANLFSGMTATMQVTPQVDETTLPEMDPVPLPVEPKIEGTDAAEQLQQQGVQVQVEGDTEQLTATIDGADGQTLMEYVDGDTENLAMKITDQDGQTLREYVTGDASYLAAVINSYNGKTITVNIKGRQMFASGGRATTASIFGEAGPEWAIPEEHSQRTADLLNAAREASGFTWPDLLARYGGLNASVDSAPTTIVYSPTIHAADANGVERVLMEDKERLNRWFEERKMRDEVEVYA